MIRQAALALLLLVSAAPALAECRQALALGLDVSGSVDAREYRLQMGGVAQALDSSEVREKLMAMPSATVHLMVFEWSGPGDQAIVVPWTAIDSETTLKAVIANLRQTEDLTALPVLEIQAQDIYRTQGTY